MRSGEGRDELHGGCIFKWLKQLFNFFNGSHKKMPFADEAMGEGLGI